MSNKQQSPFRKIQSHMVVLEACNIDTDQIIPARFLTTIQKKGLGKNLFHDWRYDGTGTAYPNFILNHPDSSKCQVLLAGNNFGCGSSREHAPWALHDYGFRVILSTKIADIFYNNALKNRLLPIEIEEDIYAWLIKNPEAEVTVDLKSCMVFLPNGTKCSFEIEPFARKCLLEGLDELGFILGSEDKITTYESTVA